MKAKNDKEVKQGVLRFSAYLMASVLLAMFIFSMYMKASSVEVAKILEKTEKYDNIQQNQVWLTEKIDSIYIHSKFLNTESLVNYSYLVASLNTKKQGATYILNAIPETDARIYKKLIRDMTMFFNLKDSLRQAYAEEDRYRKEYMRCIVESKNVNRRN